MVDLQFLIWDQFIEMIDVSLYSLFREMLDCGQKFAPLDMPAVRRFDKYIEVLFKMFLMEKSVGVGEVETDWAVIILSLSDVEPSLRTLNMSAQ